MDEDALRDPRHLIWKQIDRINALMSDGMQAVDALSILEGMLTHFKDKEWDQDYEAMNGEDTFIPRYRACIRLLARKGVWVEESIIESLGSDDDR